MAFAQYANQALRTPDIVGKSVPATIQGTISQPSRTRLVQNGVSTHLLASLLGAIALCIILSFRTTNTVDILPKNPGSIAAAASLLAGPIL
jgi:hypothetical protein